MEGGKADFYIVKYHNSSFQMLASLSEQSQHFYDLLFL